ncbi:hypothetical protein G7085_16690 [Tessaracoccus sp. HDW20]|uniref:DUF5719 family protein n=1 Tax=Tessaracoccus coleopterorum TaxID=2714950 RepID=UPI0018D3C0D8|nr:DUF5719 family protein [Tessaracoccus coleopterorum]NHB85684.1 hypothetical protein [Tessaracoccus coleopterorum]
MGRRLLYSFLAVALAVGIAVGLSLLSPLRRPPAQTVDLVRSTRLTCLPAGRALVLGDSTISLTPLGGEVGPGASGPIDTVIAGPTVLTSNSLIVGGVLTGSTPPGYVPCTAPMPTGILTVTDPASSELLLVNTDANEAVVDLTLLGSDGEIDAVGARGIAIAPGASRTIALSVLVPDAPVGSSTPPARGGSSCSRSRSRGAPSRTSARRHRPAST